jgi:poly(A) polymerase/tRNA nucleotidyltransferase (CCA-adding enzyme)
VDEAARITPPAWLTDGPVARVLAALPGARAVGGAVRDTLAGRPVADVDLATPLAPDQATARLVAAGIKVVPTGLAHGTVTAVIDRTPVEITTLRRDVETDGRHARVAFDADWRQDAARRDFTINAMSLCPDGALFDYFSGRDDLAAGRVRFVGDAARRIAEDFLRALRWFRFQARYGRGTPDAEALAAIAAAAPALDRLSAERVWSELMRILAAPDPREACALMESTGVRAVVLPEGIDHAALARLVAAGAPADPLLRLSVLLPPEADLDAFAARLRLSGDEAARLSVLRAAPVPRPGMDETALRRMLADTAPDILAARSWRAQGPAADPEWDRLRAQLSAMPVPAFPLRAADLGLPEGPRVGRVLAAMRRNWLEGGCVADRATLAAEAARRIAAGLL